MVSVSYYRHMQLDLSCFIDVGENLYNNSATSFYFGLISGSQRGPERGASGFFAITTLSPLNVTYNITSDSDTIFGTVTKNRPQYLVSVPSGYRLIRSSSFEERFRGIHIRSDQLIRVSYIYYDYDYLVLPCHEYPGVSQYDYYAVSSSSYRSTSLSQALLVGCSNNTNITIIPSVDLFLPLDAQVNGSVDILVTKGRSHTITLHEGQTLLLGKGNGSDISGTHFVSNKPMTVITGHECGSTPEMIELSICHPLQQQVPPTITWGTRFILTNFVPSYETMVYRSYVKIVTSDPNTSVTIYCNGTRNTTRYSTNGAVGIYQYNITDYCYLEGDKPICVLMFPHLKVYYTTMVLIPPMGQYLKEIEFDLYRYSFYYSRLVITALVEGFSQAAILHNGATILNWTAIYDSSQNIVAYGTEFDVAHSGFIFHSLVHTGRNGKILAQIQSNYIFRQYPSGRSAVVLLEPSKQVYL